MSILATELETAWTEVSAKHLSFEQRLPTPGAFQAIKEDTGRSPIYAEIEDLRSSENQPVKIPVLKKFDATNVTADSCAPTGQQGDTAYQSMTWQTFGFAIEDTPAIYYSNNVKRRAHFQHNIRMGLKKMTTLIDTAAITFLEAQKSALTGLSSKYFTVGSSKATFDNTDFKQLFTYAPGLLELMDLNGPYNAVGDTEAKAVLNTIAQLRAGNSQNVNASITGDLPYSDVFHHYFSNRLSSGSDQHLFYMFPEGSAGVANWISKQFVEGMTAAGGKHEWTTMTDQVMGLQWGVHTVDDCADLSGTYSWIPATKKTTTLFITNVAFVPVYSSDSTTPFIKVALNAA